MGFGDFLSGAWDTISGGASDVWNGPQTDFQATAYNPDAAAFAVNRTADPGQRLQLQDPNGAAARRAQIQWEGELLRRAQGQGPSAAQSQLQAGTDAAIAAARANAAGSTNPAMAQRMAAQQAAQITQQAGNQAAALRAQEMQQAGDTFANALMQRRGQEFQAAQANLGAGLQQRQFDTDLARQYDMADLQARMALEQMRGDQSMGAQQINAGIATGQMQAQAQNRGAVIGAGSGLLSSAAMLLSDKALKRDIKRADKEAAGFLKSLEPYAYKYKSEAHGSGQQYGIMAQDLEKTPMGRSLVIETPDGKAIDTVRGFGAVLAAMRQIDKRLEGLEKKPSRRDFAKTLTDRKRAA